VQTIPVKEAVAKIEDSAVSFGLIPGVHVEMTVLSGLQVGVGPLANWMIPARMVPEWARRTGIWS
jgi:acyl CoA:acetate/3-ketoacid CoA transferase beta subunit